MLVFTPLLCEGANTLVNPFIAIDLRSSHGRRFHDIVDLALFSELRGVSLRICRPIERTTFANLNRIRCLGCAVPRRLNWR